MVTFNTDYYTALDRGFYHQESTFSEPTEVSFPEMNEQRTNLTPREIGTTADANINPINAIQAKIREGVMKLEIPFFGQGKGGFGGQNATPEILGRQERQHMRELAKLNEVQTSTHAAPSVSVAGLGEGGFNDKATQDGIKEIEKAITFAAEATTGGPVVFHVQEWQRPVYTAGLSKEEIQQGKTGLFRDYDTEYSKAPIYLADEKTGKVTALNREMRFYFPEEEYDKDTGMRFIKTNPDGTPKVREMTFDEAVKHIKEVHKSDNALKGKTDAEIALYGYYEQQLKSSRGDIMRFAPQVEEYKKQLQKVVEAKKFAQKFWDSTPESERWKLLEKVGGDPSLFIPGETKNPVERLEQMERRYRQELEGVQSIVVAQQEKFKETEEQQKRFKPIEEVGMKRTTNSIAQLGIKAMNATDKNRKELNEPIFISPEGYEPGVYGSHPEELAKIVKESRKKMAEMLIQKGYSENDAQKKAKDHIRATIDTGHLNMWRKHFFRQHEGENEEDVEKRYKKWYTEQAKMLAREGVVGQVHLSDNWGFDDEHLSAGQGNAPLKDFVKTMEEGGIKHFIAERGSFNAQTILPDTLSFLGSPVYALGRRMNFSGVRHGHFGYAAPSNYIVGAYAPSNDFKLWSEIPLE